MLVLSLYQRQTLKFGSCKEAVITITLFAYGNFYDIMNIVIVDYVFRKSEYVLFKIRVNVFIVFLNTLSKDKEA